MDISNREKWLFILWAKAKRIKTFTLNLNDHKLLEICSEQRHRESKLRFLTLSLDDCILCEICFEQMHKEYV